MMGNLMCRLGHHRWERRRTDDGELFVACARCNTDGPYDPKAVDDTGRSIGYNFGP